LFAYPVFFNDSEWRKRARDGRQGMDAPEDSGDPTQVIRLAHFSGRNRATGNKARDQIAFRLNEIDHLWPDANGGGGQGGGMFVGPVNAQ
jgi:hypothetical protein